MQWLRKYDGENRRWTDEVFPATERLALRPDMFEVTEETAHKLQKMKEERRARETRAKAEGAELDISKIKAKQADEAEGDTADAAGIPDGNTIDTPDVTPQSPEEALAALQEEDPDDNAPMQLDELDDKNRKDLFKVIEEEELPVKKQGTSIELRDAIRAARVDKEMTK